ncbi:MAG: sulfite exporter TauE/SafE family protein, partial [Deltaproteobacteria bacterium]|nr:sulfite exporter TauE/SafE family protein [Deltaproteobacteria bacterium]
SRQMAARRERGGVAQSSPRGSVWLWLGVLATGVYGGYFGAAQGVILIAILGIGLTESLTRANAVKNTLSLIVNAIAGVVFVVNKGGKPAASARPGSGSETVGGVLAGSGSGSQPDLNPGSAGSAGSQGATTVAAGSGAGSGSAAEIKKTTAQITLTTKPAGAQIYINGILVEDVVTPMPFELPISKRPVKLTLRYKDHVDIDVKSFVVTDDVTTAYPPFQKKKSGTGTTTTNRGSGSRGSGNRGSATGTGNDTGLMRPE